MRLTTLLVLVKARIGDIGHECNLESDKVPCLVPNSFCIKGICVCAPMYQQIGGECVLKDKSSTLGKYCDSSYACKGIGEYCSSFGRSVYPGQYGCDDSRQCAKGYPGAICDAHKRCRCPNGLDAFSQNCVFAASDTAKKSNSSLLANIAKLLNEQSKRSLLAPNNRRRSIPYRFRYVNLPIKQYSPNHLVATAVPPDGLCFADQDCAGYPSAYCDGICRCSQDALNAGTTCIPSPKKTTSSGTCLAGHVYIPEAGACMTVQNPGEPCQYSQQCNGAEPGAFCSRLRCRCVYGMKESAGKCIFLDKNCTKRGYTWIPELGECKEVISPGSTGCSHSTQCSSAYNDTFCFNQTCMCSGDLLPIDGTCGERCPKDQAYSGITGQCLPNVSPGNRCLYTSQCHAAYPGLLCDKGKCRCPNKQVFSGTVCANSCLPGFIVSPDGVCVRGCLPQQIEYNGECYEQTAIGEQCVLDAQCSGGSRCFDGICLCPNETIPKAGKCEKKEVGPLSSCAMGEICTAGSFCSNGTCVCPVGTTVVNDQCITPITVPPNSPCSPSVKCDGGSECIASVCQCPTNELVVDGKCQKRPPVAIGESCNSDTTRCTGGSTCINSVCQCPFGTVVENGECRTVRRSPIGGACSVSLLCTKPAVCFRGKCQCPRGTFLKNGNCRTAARSVSVANFARKASPGSSCANGEKCSGGSNCVRQLCLCPANTQVVNGVCENISSGTSSVGKKCVVDEDCMEGAHCIEHKCQCPDGTVATAEKCLSTFGNLGFCTDSSQCTGGSFCDQTQHLCICPENQIIIGNHCVKINDRRKNYLELGFCTDNTVCKGGSICIDQRCRCLNGKILRSGTCNENNEAGINESCANGERCTHGTECSNGICLCPEKMIWKNVGCAEEKLIIENGAFHCFSSEIVGPGEYCTKPYTQCDKGSVCLDGICSCMPGTILTDDKCSKRIIALPGERCGVGIECVGGSTCNTLNDTCVCRLGTVKIGRTCRKTFRSPPGFPCGNGEECIGGSFCVENTCICHRHQLRENRRCVPKKKANPFEDCSRGQLCTGNSECDFLIKKCLCSAGYETVIYNSRKTCEATVRVLPGNSCLRSNEHCISGSYCIDGKCQCISGSYLVDNSCISILLAHPGDSCKNGERCLDGSYCNAGVCECPEGFDTVNKECHRQLAEATTIETITKRCVASNQCASGAECINGICHCLPGTKMSRFGLCVPKNSGSRIKRDVKLLHDSVASSGKMPSLGDECDMHTPLECSGNGVCDEGICTCSDGDVQNGTICLSPEQVYVPVRQINTPCTDEQICAGGSTCVQNVCKCPKGKIFASDMCITVYADIGEDCNNGEKCRKDSVCLDNVCKCAEDSEFKAGKCSTKRLRAKSPGVTCLFDPTVCVSGSYCYNGVCLCPNGNVATSTGCFTGNFDFRSGYMPQQPFSMPGLPVFGNINSIMAPIAYSAQFPSNYNYQPNSVGVPIPDIDGTDLNSVLMNNGLGSVANLNRIDPSVLANLFRMNPAVSDGIQLVSPGGPCHVGDPLMQCTGNSICANGFCSCPGGEQIVNGVCESRDTEASPGEPCQSDITRCTGGSLCILGKCVCPSNYAALDGICTPVLNAEILPNEPCMSTTSICTGQSTCIEGICTCAPGYFAAPGARVCTKIQQQSSLYFNSDLMSRQTSPLQSVVVSAPGQRCQGTSSSCSGGAMCVNGLCICPSNLVVSNGRCVPFLGEVLAGDSCSASGTVCGGGSSCVNGICTCAIGSAPRNGQCFPVTTVHLNTLPILEPGSVCTMRCNDCPKCGGGSICVDSVCKCPLGQFLFRSKCVKIIPQQSPVRKASVSTSQQNPIVNGPASKVQIKLVGPGEACSTSAICGGGSSCIIGRCVCPPGYVPNETKDSCMNSLMNQGQTIVGLNPGDDCGVSTVCSGGAACNQQICTCPSNMYPLNNICTVRDTPRQLYPGSACARIDSCLLNSQCIRGFCVCPAGFETNSRGYCIEATSSDIMNGLAGSQCNPNTLPCRSSMVCSGWGRCICSGSAEGNGLGDCILVTQSYSAMPMSSYRNSKHERCNSSADCDDTAQCNNGICGCDSGTVFRQGRCVIETTKLSADSSCNSSSDCNSGMICIDKKCSCPQGMFESATGSCIYSQNSVPPGSWCNEDSGVICSGGSKCYQNVCVCPYGHVINALECTPAPSVYPGESCMNGEICIGGSLCREGICSCPSGSTVPGQSCSLSRHIRSISEFAGSKIRTDYFDQIEAIPQIPEGCPADNSCVLPECYCSRSKHQIPGSLSASDVPQIVILTFEGPVSDKLIDILNVLLDGRHRNPNGCPITASFYVTHNGTNYDQVQWLASQGHEIGLSSFSGTDMSMETDKNLWLKEISSMRSAIERFSFIPIKKILGFRSPHLKHAGIEQYEALKRLGIVYDSSVTLDEDDHWPQTLDYNPLWNFASLSGYSFPGLWEIPVAKLFINESSTTAVDFKELTKHISLPEELADILYNNLNRKYTKTKAPYVIAIETKALIESANTIVPVLETFITNALNRSDVYMVSTAKALQWLQQPTELLRIHNFKPWKCPNPSMCTYTCDRDQSQSFRVCGKCPYSYPTLYDPYGES
uniref:EB domain-containing protein n=1 Tax=Syphacia muris TaxID=451379 RepID=A0A0N5AL14_9BILA